MTRIIGGSAGGRRLRTPRGDLTRPTTDRVREALFSALESTLGTFDGLRFLDLYAGSGAVGLEARSRGAASVTLVEQDRRTASLAKANAQSVGLTDVRVVCAAVARHLAGPAEAAYDVAFLDPPYAMGTPEVVADLTALAGGWLTPGAVVVVERATRNAPAWPPGYEPGRVRAYGETSLSFATWSAP
jgi:16S rRNA (guanine966-N2)-methyltransferase